MTQETKLKFYTSQETGKLVSFVSVTKANRLKGVREDSDCKKKNCSSVFGFDRFVEAQCTLQCYFD